MSEMKYTEDHEWVRLEDDGSATVGITDHAQEQLGDLVFVELPDVDSEISKGDEAATLESVKAAGEVHAPISGTVTEINEVLADEPGKVNEDPTGDGWFFKMSVSDASEADGLMDEAAYKAFLESLD